MIHPRTAGLLGALLFSALLLVGCSGGGGEPTVSQSVHDVLQHELDEALEKLVAEREAKTREAAARRTAQGEVTRLNTQLATANTEVTRLNTELATTNAKVTQLEGERATATAEVTRLTGRIGTAADAASSAESASLYAQLNHAKAEVTRFEGELATATTNADDLSTKLTAANAKVTELTAQIGNKSDTASAAESASLHAQLNHAKTEVVRLTAELSGTKSAVETLTGQLGTVRTELEEETERATAAEQEAQQARTEANQRTSTLEANQRAENLRKVFPGSSLSADAALDSPAVGTGASLTSPVTITVPTRNALTFNQGTRTVRRVSEPGLQGARLTRSRGGTSTTVIYTDRELSRRLLDHFGAATSGTGPVRFDATHDDLPEVVEITLTTTDLTEKPWSISRPSEVSSSMRATAAGDLEDEGQARESIPGSLYGIPGRFECGTGCMITPTGDYVDPDIDTTPTTEDPETWSLDSLTIAVSTGAVVYFRPNSPTASVSLCANIGTGSSQCVANDTEYMVFGYWWDEPANALGDYAFGVFADIAGGTASGLAGTAEYDGTAVGMYVEQGALGTSGVTTKQGEFTADVRLDVDFDASGNDIEGTIDGFEVTPTGGSAAPTTADTWVVKLEAAEAAPTAGTGTATIDIRGTNSTGAWSHAFVANHGTAAAGLQPPAITGMFNTRIPNLLHLVGAFGAERQ